ncbi:VOC family protein [Candidatus Entotheonella palauensis]|uniref:Glyoxalase n=1 Tax=Candidatus Entotheonella gemina TaxID=1429439 RepID=W4M972_9BACT|nr:VOC family protein [Candidatus Entotheonella palauensis]ETX06735.1 MAG: glyoxalase [Candidatus Entotheonella gemina]
MLSLRGVYEIGIRVKNLARSEAFYCDLLGLKRGLRAEQGKWLFLWVDGRAGMVVLQEDDGDWPTQHFAFAVEEEELARAADMLEEQGIAVRGPVYHRWMQAKSLYCSDPDGHELEFCAPLPVE